jgi:hypothetical protein
MHSRSSSVGEDGSGHGKARRSAGLFRSGDRYRTGVATGSSLRIAPTEGTLGSIAHAVGIDINIPDHTTFSRRWDDLTPL